MKNVKVISSGFTLQIGRKFDILSLFLILSRQKCMIIYGGQIPESFAKSKGVWFARGSKYLYHMEKFTQYSIKKILLQLYYSLTSPYRHLYNAKNHTFPTSTIRTPLRSGHLVLSLWCPY